MRILYAEQEPIVDNLPMRLVPTEDGLGLTPDRGAILEGREVLGVTLDTVEEAKQLSGQLAEIAFNDELGRASRDADARRSNFSLKFLTHSFINEGFNNKPNNWITSNDSPITEKSRARVLWEHLRKVLDSQVDYQADDPRREDVEFSGLMTITGLEPEDRLVLTRAVREIEEWRSQIYGILRKRTFDDTTFGRDRGATSGIYDDRLPPLKNEEIEYPDITRFDPFKSGEKFFDRLIPPPELLPKDRRQYHEPYFTAGAITRDPDTVDPYGAPAQPVLKEPKHWLDKQRQRDSLDRGLPTERPVSGPRIEESGLDRYFLGTDKRSQRDSELIRPQPENPKEYPYR